MPQNNQQANMSRQKASRLKAGADKLLQLAQAWSSYCITIWGWRKTLLSMGLGGLSVLALPPIYIFPILFFTMPSLLWLLDGAIETTIEGEVKPNQSKLSKTWARIYGARSAFGVGLSFGFGYFFFGLLWIGEAFLVDASAHILLLPFAVTLLPLILGLFWGFAALTARVFWGGPVKNVIILAISLIFWEFLRGNIFTGLPLNLMGFAFDFSTALLQSASIWGVYGLTFIVIILALSASLFINSPYRPRLVFFGIFGILAVLWLGGSARLYMNPTQFHTDILMRLVQGNIDQKDKWRDEMRSIIANRYLELSGRQTSSDGQGSNRITHLIWPESAMPFLLEPDSSFMREATRILNEDAYLIAGAVRRQINGETTEFYNSVLAFDAGSNRLGKYDKHHLVPFGEYLPLRNLLEKGGLRKLVQMRDNFETGDAPSNIYLKNTPAFAVNICFEIIFSADVVDRENRPEWILNVTNDAWFGNSIGPYQHLAQARMRAVEEGLPLVRAANTGITAVFDPLGRVIGQLQKGESAVLDSPLPLKINPTPYVWLTTYF